MAVPLLLAVCFGGVQILGFASVAWARMSKGSTSELTSQYLFYGLLLFIGAITAAASCTGNGWWPLSAVTFGVMVVGATIHTRHEEEAF